MALFDHFRSAPSALPESGGATMSFLQHLEELRRRIFLALLGVVVAF